MPAAKPLEQWIIESIDEELAERSGLTGHEIYRRGVERGEQAYHIRTMAKRRRAMLRGLVKKKDAN